MSVKCPSCGVSLRISLPPATRPMAKAIKHEDFDEYRVRVIEALDAAGAVNCRTRVAWAVTGRALVLHFLHQRFPDANPTMLGAAVGRSHTAAANMVAKAETMLALPEQWPGVAQRVFAARVLLGEERG